jgi:hypothetical protein
MRPRPSRLERRSRSGNPIRKSRLGFGQLILGAALLAMPSCDSCESRDPELRVSPSTFSIGPGDGQALVTVHNVGEAELEWAAASQTEWISLVSPGSGRLMADESEDVMLSFDSALMSFGSTTGEVRFSANGRIPTWSIAVSLSVDCPGSVAQPAAGAVWHEGEAREITWDADGVGKVGLELLMGSQSVLIGSDEPNDGSFDWVVNSGGLANELCVEDFRVRLTPIGRQDCDRFSEPFCIRPMACTSPPEAVCAPSPADQAVGIGQNADLGWSCGTSTCNRPVTYRVYFGTNPNPGVNELLGTTAEKSWDLPELDPSSRYYWRIVTVDGNGVAPGPVWEFATGGPPCTDPPDPPCNSAPLDDATNVSIDADLTWNCADSPCALPVTFRVYFGTNPNPGPAQLLGTTAEKVWDLPRLAEDTHYYWKIESVDDNGTTAGPVWDFVTAPAPCTTPPSAPCTPLPADDAAGTSFNVDLAWGCGDIPC